MLRREVFLELPQSQTVGSPWNRQYHVPNQAGLCLVWDKGASVYLHQSLHFVQQKKIVEVQAIYTFDAVTDPGHPTELISVDFITSFPLSKGPTP